MDGRRGFMKKVIGAFGLGIVALKSGVAFAKKLAVPLDKVAALKQVGGSARIKLSGKEVLLIRDTEKTVKAMDPHCTHRDCLVGYNKKTGKVDCSCHGSSFDLNGKVLGGPATKNMKTYAASLAEGQIVVTVD